MAGGRLLPSTSGSRQPSMAGLDGGGAPPAVCDPNNLPAAIVLVFPVMVVALLCWRAARTRRNKDECRRLAQRVALLRDLRQLMAPAPPLAKAAAVSAEVRAVLAGQVDAWVKEAESVVLGCTSSRWPCRFVRCDRHGEQLSVVRMNLDEAYDRILPVVAQIDTAHRLHHLLQLQVIVQDGHKYEETDMSNGRQYCQRPPRPKE
uniref:Mixed lineage kinase domain-containing protein n=1 Tax=Oryza rufipogon TaxID=4529 RepID=A0A0E0Q4B5_ORYRU